MLQEITEGEGLGTDQGEGRTRRLRPLEQHLKGLDRILDVDGLKACPAAADERQHGRYLGHGSEAGEEVVTRTVDQARPHEGRCRERCADRRLAPGLGAVRGRGCVLGNGERGEVQQPLLPGRGGDNLRPWLARGAPAPIQVIPGSGRQPTGF